MSIEGQVHGKFKLFAGTLDGDGGIGTLARRVEAWVKFANVAPKSIGVEYLESTKRVLLTIGYRDDEAGYAVKLTAAPIGKLGSLDDADIGRLEGEMEKACDKLSRIICHELYVTETGDFSMVFMTHEA
jgi:hypothetical protein